jgi:hypothetical protein
VPIILLGLPLVLFGALTHIYLVEGKGKCFLVDAIGFGPFCWNASSLLPEAIVYGVTAVGLVLMIWGNIQVRRKRNAAGTK